MKARVNNPLGDIVMITLEPGETFAEYYCPKEAPQPMSVTVLKNLPSKTTTALEDAVANGLVVEPFAEPARDLSEYARILHARVRDGGVTINGLRIKTDAESRSLIDGAYALTQARPNLMIDFKTAGGWVQIDAQTMQHVATAVGLWVQACYSAYRQIDEKITAKTLTTSRGVEDAFAQVSLPA